MAEINITKGFNSLTGVFNPAYIQFTITSGTIPTITIEGYSFAPVKILTSGGLDTYVMDFQDILKYIIGLPEENINNLNNLKKTVTATVSAPASTSKTSSTILCYAYDMIRTQTTEDVSVRTLYDAGSRKPQYHYGDVWIFFSGASGNYSVRINGETKTKYLNNGYTLINISDFANQNGYMEIVGTSSGSQIIRVDKQFTVSDQFLYWIDSDGKPQKHLFDIVKKSTATKNVQSVPVYNYVYELTKSLDRVIKKESITGVVLNTVAFNYNMYNYLLEISKSLIIFYSERYWKIKSIPENISECRQNLSFTIELELEDYAPSY